MIKCWRDSKLECTILFTDKINMKDICCECEYWNRSKEV